MPTVIGGALRALRDGANWLRIQPRWWIFMGPAAGALFGTEAALAAAQFSRGDHLGGGISAGLALAAAVIILGLYQQVAEQTEVHLPESAPIRIFRRYE
ncbi:MAG: hypothetical protein ACSLE3_06765 [Microbacteriaceae bacterium]